MAAKPTMLTAEGLKNLEEELAELQNVKRCLLYTSNGYTYRSFGSNAKYDYAVFGQGTDEYAQKYAQLVSVSVASIKQYYDEKYDRSNFIKNVILDNILPGDIYLKARELHFNSEVSRDVYKRQCYNIRKLWLLQA